MPRARSPYDRCVNARIVLVSFALMIVAVNGCVGCDRSWVSRPELALTVTGEDGAPVAGARVHAFAWSDPHGVLDRSSMAVTDRSGRVAFSRETEEETVYPLCMHGVPAHAMTICVESEGRQAVAFEMDPAGSEERTVTLAAGEGEAGCDFDAVQVGQIRANGASYQRGDTFPPAAPPQR
jgi:hypothetical protein